MAVAMGSIVARLQWVPRFFTRAGGSSDEDDGGDEDNNSDDEDNNGGAWEGVLVRLPGMQSSSERHEEEDG